MSSNFSIDCPISNLLILASAKWTVEVLRELTIQPTRTRQFLRRIPGLSMKSLQERLHQLEAAGLINRKDYGTLPKKVEFSLTEHGRRLMEIMADIKKLSDDIHQQNGNCRCPFELSRGQAGLQNAGFDCPVRFDKD